MLAQQQQHFTHSSLVLVLVLVLVLLLLSLCGCVGESVSSCSYENGEDVDDDKQY